MTLAEFQPKPKSFTPGTTGWTAADLDDPAVESAWSAGRFEIIEGVLTIMPAAYFYGHECAANLLHQLQTHIKQNKIGGACAFEVDIVIDDVRVVRGDVVYLSPEDRHRQKEAAIHAGRSDLKRTRILVPPTLLVEAVSPGHEAHDRKTKFKWYAAFGVPNYWILDPLRKTLECLVLQGDRYDYAATGKNGDRVPVPCFAGLSIDLAEVWGQDEP